MTRRIFPSPAAGFTLVELLVALATLGILLAMLVQVTGQVATNTQALSGRMENISEAARLRRLLHRDLTSATPNSFAITTGGFKIASSHNLLLGQPLPVTVEWNFSGGAIRRIETLEKQGYAKELLLSADLSSWKTEIFNQGTHAWIDLRDILTGNKPLAIAGLRLTLDLPEGTVEMVEQLPEAE